ncbi:hypothetical protein WMY93_024485 [Mugilogobius chulae]|uniref:Torsin-1A-interacting protein 1/2 AAA+ activator domain-containing protein n=1 Tax=Mugilogobius chulae TaxID=88201 RepID=A0AAW0MZR1_9GOBI
MNSEESGKAPTQLRRSARRSISANVKENYGPTPRGPLKRTKKSLKPQSEVPASNGTNDKDSEDEGSPNKKICMQTGDVPAGEDGNGPRKDVFEPMETENQSEGLEGDIKASIKLTPLPQNPPVPGPFGDFNLKPLVVLAHRCSHSHSQSENVNKTQEEYPKKKVVSSSKFNTQISPTKSTSDTRHVTVTSMAEYKKNMEAKITEVNHHIPLNYPTSATTTRQRTTVSTPKKSELERQQGIAKKKTTLPLEAQVFHQKLVLLILLSGGLFLAFKHLQTLQRTKEVNAHSSKFVNSGHFVKEMSHVALRFPSQRPELWKRSQIHLQKHLDTPEPTELVSLILTAGLKAEKTLHCLAHNIASAFATAVNSSVIVIDGASQASLDSDQAKMEIDNQLKEAFGSDKLAAIVHHFDELPPGSALIFYRYCDHENAAYKRAFLLFTVQLSTEEISPQTSLKDVEEMVRDHIEKKFVENESAFNKMDTDKFSGLWSRIAHLILPVAYEDEIEQRGC